VLRTSLSKDEETQLQAVLDHRGLKDIPTVEPA